MKLALIPLMLGLVLVISSCVSVFDCFTAAAEARIDRVEQRYAADLVVIEAMGEPGYTASRKAIEARYSPVFEAYRAFRKCVEEASEVCAMVAFERFQIAASVVDPAYILERLE